MDAESGKLALDWWNQIGSGISPLQGDDWESHSGRVSMLAFCAGRDQSNAKIAALERALIEIEFLTRQALPVRYRVEEFERLPNFSQWLKNRSKS